MQVAVRKPKTRTRSIPRLAFLVCGAVSLLHCAESAPLEIEATDAPAPAYMRSGVVETCDGNAPDTVAFLARILNWDGTSKLHYQVELDSLPLVAGSVDYDQVQVVFAVDPSVDLEFRFSAWSAGTDTTHAEWASPAGTGD
jgi:hypothetical protein